MPNYITVKELKEFLDKNFSGNEPIDVTTDSVKFSLLKSYRVFEYEDQDGCVTYRSCVLEA